MSEIFDAGIIAIVIKSMEATSRRATITNAVGESTVTIAAGELDFWVEEVKALLARQPELERGALIVTCGGETL